MTKKEFIEKYHISPRNREDILKVLDILFLEYNLQDILDMMRDFYRSADDIFNDK